MIVISESAQDASFGPSDGDAEPLRKESLAEELRRKYLEARVNADEIHRSEREFRAFEERTLRENLDRLKNDRESEQQAWRVELAALHDAWEAERRGWREQLEAAHRQAHLARDSARAADARLKAQGELNAQLTAERDSRVESFEALIAKVLRDADDRLVGLNDLRRERDELRDEIEAIRSERRLPFDGSTRETVSDLAAAVLLDALKADRDELSQARDVLQLALEDAEAAARTAEQAHADRLAAEQAKVVMFSEKLDALSRSQPPRGSFLPILSRDLARWSTPPPLPPVAELVAQSPPSTDDLAAAERQVEMLRKLIRMPVAPGRPFHSLLDEARYVTLQSRLREASLLAERLFSQVERSRSSKDLLWHLMVAQRTDEINRNKRR